MHVPTKPMETLQNMKRFHYIPLCSILFLFCYMTSCGDSKRKAYEEAVIEWTGKEILFPDSMRLVGGGMIVKPEADFTIVSYYDSVGCTGCLLKLQFWNEFMERVDSVRGDKTVNLVMIVSSNDEKELDYIRIRDNFRHIIVYDSKDIVNSLNNFSEDVALRTFLIDRKRRILTFGNPVTNKRSSRLYLSIIGENEIDIDKNDEWLEYSHDFGNILSGEKVCHVFPMENKTSDTIRVKDIISSCECTEGIVSPMVVSPGGQYNVVVSFRDTIPGNFLRSVMVYFENQKSLPLRFEVTGQIITNK